MTDQETAADTQAQGGDDTDDLDLTVPEQDTDVGQMQEDLAALRAQVGQLQTELKAAQSIGGADPQVVEDALLENAPSTRGLKRKEDARLKDRELGEQLGEARRVEEGRSFPSPQTAEAKKKAERLRRKAQEAAKQHGMGSEEFAQADREALAAEWESSVGSQLEGAADEAGRRLGERPEITVPEIDPDKYRQWGDRVRKGANVVESDEDLAFQLGKLRQGENP